MRDPDRGFARIGSLSNRKVAVLGLTFKRDTDDERDSLSPKLIRALERELADVVIMATNHSEFEGPGVLAEIVSRTAADCLLVDPWNALGTGQVFLFVAESAMLISEAAAGASETT